MHLEPPTHLFIGGSSGNLKEILTVVKQKNPNVKIVISAISLETVRDVMDAEKRRVTDRYGSYTDMCVAFSCSGAVSYDDRNESCLYYFSRRKGRWLREF